MYWFKRLFRRKPTVTILGCDISNGGGQSVFIYGYYEEDGTLNITSVENVGVDSDD